MAKGEIALGKHQIVPKYWFETVGLDPTSAADRQKFLNSPELQDQAFENAIADGERRYPGDYGKQAAVYYGGEGGAAVLGTAAGDKPQSAGAPSVNSYSKSVVGRIPDDNTESTGFSDFLANAPRAPAEFELPSAPPSDNFTSFLASAPKEQAPTLGANPQQGPINLDQGPRPVAKGLPALQPAPQIQGVEPQPTAPIPFTSVPPQLANFQPPQAPTPQENLQAAADKMPVGPEEFNQGVIKGMAQGASAGLYKPPIYEKQQPAAEMGRLIGSAAPMALGPLGGEAAATGMASQAFLQNAKPDTEGKAGIANPIETTVQTALAAVLGSVGPGAMPSIVKRIGAGAGIGGAQAIAGTVTQKIAQLANEGKVDIANQEDVKNLAISMLQGAIFGAHGGEGGGEHGTPTEIQHPGEIAQPIPQQPSFADKAAQDALQNTQTQFTPYDVEGKGEPPINVPQGPEAATNPQANQAQAHQDLINKVAEIYGPEKAQAFQTLMGGNLPKLAEKGYNVRLQNVDEVQAPGSANASDLNSKNSSSSMRNPSSDNLANGGGGIPGTPEAMANDPSLRNNTWTGNRPTLQNEDLGSRNDEMGMSEPVAMPENVPPAPEEVKPQPFALKRLDKRPDQIPTLRQKVRSILQGQKIYLDENARAQLGISKGGAREYGPIFTNDKQTGLSFDRVAEMIREQAANGAEHYQGIGDGRNVEANDVIDALFNGNQEYKKAASAEPDHVSATNDILRNGNPDVEGAIPTPARGLENEFDAGGMKFKRVKTTEPGRITYKDEYGGRYDFKPDEVVHVGGELKAPEQSKEPAPATTPEEDFTGLFQKGPPKTSQEDMFGNKGRVASEGFIKGKGEDKGLEGTPLFEGEKQAEQKKAEEDQQRLFQGEGNQERKLPQDNYRKPLKEYTPTLYRETSLYQALPYMPNEGTSTDMRPSEPYFSDRPETALGQGNNRGVVLKFDSGDLHGKINTSKPGWEHSFQRGTGEYIGRLNDQQQYQDALRSITIKKDAKVDNISKTRFNRYAKMLVDKEGWTRSVSPEGDVTFARPEGESTRLLQGKPEQEIKGYTDFNPAKKEFVISLVNGKADVSTLFHEFFHVLEQGGIISKADRAILTKALEAHGVTDALNAKGVFKEAGAEKVADWWERYLRDGKSPVPELQKIFDKVRNWMVDVYRSIKGTRLEGQVPHSVRAVFDRVIEGGRQAEGPLPEEGRLAQKSGNSPKPTEQMVGPNAPRNQKPATREDFMVMEAKAGDHESGYLTNPEKFLFGAADRAYPIKKIQKIYEKEFGVPVDSDQDLKYAINRIYGAAGTADEFINKNLAPAIEGGTIKGQQFERLQPAESKRMFEYLLAKDALWRYKNTEGYEMPNNLSKKMAEGIVEEHNALAAKSPAQYEKLEKAAAAMVNYAQDLAVKKLEMGLWTPEEFKAITTNPHYIPEIRYWAKDLATGKKGGQALDFASSKKLVRGTEATSENVPVFDPLTSLIHDTHQLAKEGAKHYLGNAIIDMQESSPELQKIITEQEPDYKPKAHEGTFPVRRPRTTVLSPEQTKFAERYQNAVYQLEAEENSTGTSKEDQILEQNRRKIQERVQALPAAKRDLLGQDMMDIVNKVEESRQKWKAKRLKDAQETEAEFRALPAEQQKIIKRWMKEGQVTNYTIPIELAQAMNAMEPVQYGTIGKILKGATTIFKKGTVTWNPGFAMINAARDVQEAYINTGMRPDYAIKGWLDFMRHSDLYHQYMERGGAIGSGESGFKGSTTRSGDLRYGRRVVRDRFNKVMDPEAWKSQTVKIGDKEYKVGKLARLAEAGIQAGKLPMEAMEAFGHMSEMSTRLGIMRYGMEKLGMNADQAVNLARHGTLDFDQRGASLNVQRAMDIVPFLNPRIQGTLRTGRRLMDGKQAVKTMVLGGLAPMLGLTAANMLNPNYANVSDRDKRYAWIIMIPGTDKHIAIPKPQAIQVLFNPFQMALEKAVGTSPTSLRQQAIDNMQEILPVTDPSSILPPLAKAVLENKVNKDMYWNRPVVKEEGREPVDQYDPKTTTTMKRVAEKLQWLPNEVEWLKSPERLQHIANTMLGGTAGNLLFLTDMLLGDAKKTLRSDYVPVVSRFYKGAEEWQGELANQQRQLMSDIKLKERSAGSSTEIMQDARMGEKPDAKAITDRLHHTAGAIGDTFRKLGEVNQEMARVRELVQAVKEHNPGVKYHFLRPPTLTKPSPPAPSGASPIESPAPEDATVPSMSETTSE